MVLFQVKRSVRSLLKKSLSKDVQKPLHDDGLFLTEATPSLPTAAPGILLFFLIFIDARSIQVPSLIWF